MTEIEIPKRDTRGGVFVGLNHAECMGWRLRARARSDLGRVIIVLVLSQSDLLSERLIRIGM